MEWNGQELDTIGKLLDTVAAIPTREEAQEFMAAYRAENEHADANIGYIAGYCSNETAKRIWDWFGTAHPVFGTTIPNIHIGSTAQGRSVDVGVQDGQAVIWIGGEGNPSGPAIYDDRAMALSITEADIISRLLLAAVRTAKKEVA